MIAGLTPYQGQWNEANARHLLKRTVFGATKEQVDAFASLGLAACVEKLLDDTLPQPNPPVKEYNSSAAASPDTLIAMGQTWVNDPNNDGTVASLRRASFKKWWVGTMLFQDPTLREKMTLFWHNHFATESADVGNAQYVYKHHQLLRTHALGNIKTLTRAVTIDPAMLVYLNGQNNNRTAPDENYSREIQELFVVGKGPGSGFTEADVKAAARILTGWRNNATKIESYFDATRHDTANKEFSTFYGNRVIAGRTGATAGDQELDDLITMLFSVDEAALFLCRKLYRWFLYYDIPSEIEASVIAPLAKIMRDNNFEVKPVLRALFSSAHFYESTFMGAQIKSPVDMLIGMLRESDVKFAPADSYAVNYPLWNQLVSYLTNMQQNIADPPDVSGWKAYYQEPGYYGYWVNTDTLPKRIQYLDILATTGYTMNGFKVSVNGVSLVRKFSRPEEPNLLIDDLVKHFLGLGITPAHKAQLKRDILLAGQSEDYYWTNAWETYITAPSNAANTKHVTTAITSLIKYLMNLPEFQLM
ncbi:MAG: hypothetical protein RIQ50_1222 [Bacteroidota bacterium]|jgi:uncharacterized protein (DUF1800 family)